MKYLCILIALFASVPHVYADPQLSTRPLDAWAEESLQRGRKQSALVRHLLSVIDASNVIVHVETSSLIPAAYAGTTRFVTSQYGYRYIRIVLNRELSPFARAWVLGHELQHACEIAESKANTQDEVRLLFEELARTGPSDQHYFETEAAVMAGQRVANEMRARSYSSGQ